MFSRHLILPMLALGLLAACGDNRKQSADSVAPTTAAGAPTTTADIITTTTLQKPEVSIPADLPTELVVTDITVGTGPAAKDGDTVLVNYVGVRSADGTEFDNSYERGEPLVLVLGQGRVITGWDQGLVGAQTGGRRQLDIPADLAYGDNPQGDVIQPGDALSFVVDVVAVIPPPDPALEPTVTVSPAANAESLEVTDLVVGTGVSPQAGQTVWVQLIAYRADTGEKLYSTWPEGATPSLSFGTGQVMPGLDQLLAGMKAGGRRQATIPFALAFGDAGSESMGLPASTDLVLVVDLVAVS